MACVLTTERLESSEGEGFAVGGQSRENAIVTQHLVGLPPSLLFRAESQCPDGKASSSDYRLNHSPNTRTGIFDRYFVFVETNENFA